VLGLQQAGRGPLREIGDLGEFVVVVELNCLLAAGVCGSPEDGGWEARAQQQVLLRASRNGV
jgi:hypothetical protein